LNIRGFLNLEIDLRQSVSHMVDVLCKPAQREESEMNLDEAITGRRAVRDYTVQAIDEQAIRSLIASAVQAPSAVNQQPWAFTVVRDQGLLDKISRTAKAHMLATMQGNPHADHFQTHLSDPAFHIFYHAPVLILISATAEGPWIVEDCSLAAENLMLAAHANGLGSCWIGFAQGLLNTPEGKAMLDIPSAWVPVAPIIVGYPKAAPPQVPRKEPIIRWIG
jgi:nitroreductase